jgi:predicted NBD/HSP70 family sugar kinase
MNEHLVLGHIREIGSCSRADLARVSGLSQPTVSLALANLEKAGLVREAGQRTGRPGRSALLYEIRPEAGYVLGLHVGHQYLRGAVADMTGKVLARSAVRAAARSTSGRVDELAGLADTVCASAGVDRTQVIQTVLGSPGRLDARRNAITLAEGMAGWTRAGTLDQLHDALGAGLVIENDVDAATLAERDHGVGAEGGTFALLWVGTGIGMGLVIGGVLHRGAHGVAGEIGYMPLETGNLEEAGSATAVVRSAREAGLRGPVSARRVFEAAAAGDERAVAAVTAEARLIARSVCAVVTVVDPDLIVLGGGVGQAPGFAAAVAAELAELSPAAPEVLVSALGHDAVVDGCLVAGGELAWQHLTASLQRPA